MRKKILCAIMSAVMVVGSLTGCGNDKTKSEIKNKTEVSETIGNEQGSSEINAYKKFYSRFYSEHLSDDENIKNADCAAKLVMDGSGNLLLAITDMQSADEEGNVLLDFYLYENKDNEVIQKVKIPNIKAWDDGMGIAIAGNNILVWTEYYDGDDNGGTIFVIDGEKYNEVKDAKYDGEGYTVETGIGESGTDSGMLVANSTLVNLFFSDSGNPVKFCVSGQDFEDWLDYYSQNEVTSSLKLDILYAEYLEKNRYYDLEDGEHLTQYVRYWKDGIYYSFVQAGTSYNGYNVRDEDCLYIMADDMHAYIDDSYLNKNILGNIPNDIDGIKVIVTDECKNLISQAMGENNENNEDKFESTESIKKEDSTESTYREDSTEASQQENSNLTAEKQAYDVEEEVNKIRDIYYWVQGDSSNLTKQDGGSVTRWIDSNGKIRKIVAPAGTYDDTNGADAAKYNAEFYYNENEELVFVFLYSGKEEHRLYVVQGKCVRYIDQDRSVNDYPELKEADSVCGLGYFIGLGMMEIHYAYV